MIEDMSLKEKIIAVFEECKEGADFGIYFNDGTHEEICIDESYANWEITNEYLYYESKDQEEDADIFLVPLEKIKFIRML